MVWLLKPGNPLSSQSTAGPSITSSWLSLSAWCLRPRAGGRLSELWPCLDHAEAPTRSFASGNPFSHLYNGGWSCVLCRAVVIVE